MAELIGTTSPHDVATTVDRVAAALQRRGITLFATVDHAAGARAAGLALDDEVLMIFGNAAVGTALMQADPRAGIDLPLRLLVWAQDGATHVAFRDPHELAADHELAGRGEVLDALRRVLDALVAEATAPDAAAPA
jgi:uncharacterized protein (DUF302 family)